MKKIILTTIIALLTATGSFAQYSGGDGSESNPYLISSNADMETLAANVNGGYSYSGIHFLLTQNLTGITTAIGNANPFSGIFDGGGHVIDASISTSNDYGGIFGCIRNATIKNLGHSGSISSSAFSGGICGFASLSTISNCYSLGETISGPYSGGICGFADRGEIINCIAYNQAITASSIGGRIIGAISSGCIIENCYALPSILVNGATRTSQSASNSHGKDLSSGPGAPAAFSVTDINYCCSNNPIKILLLNTSNILRWERSTDGQNWEDIDHTDGVYTEEDPSPGTLIYRALNGDGSYSDQVTVHYSKAIPSTISVSPNSTVTRTVDDPITFTLDVDDDGYNYQWYRGGLPVAGATSNTYPLPAIKMADTGTYYCVISNGCNTVTTNSVLLPINKATQQITFGAIADKTYGDADFYLPQYTNKNLPITYVSGNVNVVKISGNKVEITGAGNANITASHAGDENYFAASNVSQPIFVAKSQQQIAFEALPAKTFGDANFTLSASNNSGVPIVYESSNPNVATITLGNTVCIVGTGETYITASSAGNSNYFAATPQQQLLTVNKSAQTVSLAVISDKIYGDEPFTLSGTSSAGLPVTYKSSEPSKLLISGNTAYIMAAGTFTITATQEGNGNYLSNSATRTFTVTKAPLIVRAENKERFYGDENPALTYIFDGFKNGDSKSEILSLPTISCSTSIEDAAGDYNITVSDASDNNYSFLYQNGRLTVKKNPLIVTPSNETRMYGEENPAFTLIYSGFKNDEDERALTEAPIAATNAKISSSVGLYDIIVSRGAATNYEFIYQTGKLEITLRIGLESISVDNLLIFPNPAKDYLHIRSDLQVEKIEIYNQSGICVLIESNFMEKLSVSHLPDGLYFVRIFTVDGKYISRKVMVEK